MGMNETHQNGILAEVGGIVALVSFVFLCLLFKPSHVLAQAAALPIGEAKLYPSLRISYFNNDNVFASSGALQEATAGQFEPKLSFVADKGANGLELGYHGIFHRSEFARADFDDHILYMKGKAVMSIRIRTWCRAKLC